MKPLSRDVLLERLAELEFWPELRADLEFYLDHYIQALDLDCVQALLNAGADPNPASELDCYLHQLLHEYEVTRSTNGHQALLLIEVLLEAGAQPNRIGCNNLRAYDYAVARHQAPVVALLERYGADKTLRHAI